MDARLSKSSKAKKRRKRRYKDRHGWNTLEDYGHIYHSRLDGHPFIDHSKPLPEIELYYSEDGKSLIGVMDGFIYCLNNIILEVRKTFDVKEVGSGLLKLRGVYYCYNAHIKGRSNILRYDNAHGRAKYHKHIYNINTGEEIENVPLTRKQFPLLHEVVDELQKSFSDI